MQDDIVELRGQEPMLRKGRHKMSCDWALTVVLGLALAGLCWCGCGGGSSPPNRQDAPVVEPLIQFEDWWVLRADLNDFEGKYRYNIVISAVEGTNGTVAQMPTTRPQTATKGTEGTGRKENVPDARLPRVIGSSECGLGPIQRILVAVRIMRPVESLLGTCAAHVGIEIQGKNATITGAPEIPLQGQAHTAVMDMPANRVWKSDQLPLWRIITGGTGGECYEYRLTLRRTRL